MLHIPTQITVYNFKKELATQVMTFYATTCWNSNFTSFPTPLVLNLT